MYSKRFILFANPPTKQELQSISSLNPVWNTRTIHATSRFTTPTEYPSQAPELPLDHHPASSTQPPWRTTNTLTSQKSPYSGPRKRVRLNTKSIQIKLEIAPQSLPAERNDPVTANCESIDYYQSQLDYHDSFQHPSGHLSLTLSPGNRTSCLLSQPTSQSPATYQQASQSQATYSDSMVINPPQWHFDVRSSTPLDQLTPSPGRLYNILFYLCEKKHLTTIQLNKPRKNGEATVEMAHFDCIDETGSALKLVLWDEVAESLDDACLVGDIIYLSGIAISAYQGKPQASSTPGTRAQICYRLRPTHASHLESFCPDLRLAYDPTTRRVSQLVDWAKAAFF